METGNSHRISVSATLSLALFASLALPMNVLAQGQVMDQQAAAKKPDAAARPTPRTADGHPDLSGVWHHFFMQGAYEPLQPGASASLGGAFGGGGRGGAGRGGAGRGAAGGPGGPPAGGAPPAGAPPAGAGPAGGRGAGAFGNPADADNPTYKPELVAKVKDLNDRQSIEDATLRCGPPGVPRLGPPHQIIQTPKGVVFLYSDLTGEFFRVIPTDGGPVRKSDEPTYMGDASGHWDGDTLVVVSTNFTDESWLGDNGLFHSTALHVTERLQRKGDTLRYEVTVDDPNVLATPWVMKPRVLTLQDDLLEEAAPCVDKDVPHITDLSHHGNAR